ncbi:MULTISPECIES: sporulation protein YabP [Oscillospiraceae]|uniref:sporulation protein YabP n=1 Tax=Oscillospiraceae TaxID=216572 RepID=UPI000B3858E4|nr:MULTISPECIES: sporulation protein YabP [Oscillospiraceae]MBM6721786.1 sporulation protein YabP [Pseudoflavonifractor phocaeensis]MBM6884838.1 sporulation protein YabP [Pseudoflavonifractor phocaeensis]OUO35690.1 sporulation protein YabP [Flavonifractor sp. An306]
MPYEDNRGRPETAHHIIVEERERLSVSGVEEVERFDENTIVMTTVRGTLVIQGENLHIEKLSLDGGDLKVEGDIDALSYEDSGRSSSGGLLSRLFR